MTIGVIDYGMGNLRSVVNAFGAVGASASVVRSPEELADYSGVVLPGVGAFKDGMTRLRSRGWIDPLEHEVLEKRKPFLGLCLGMQLMASRGNEHGDEEGLGWVPGRVARLSVDPSMKIPHVGWNDVMIVRDGRLFRGMGESDIFYFLHSYHMHPHDEGVLVAKCSYGMEFAAAVEADNLFGAQFHPEKSQRAGLRFLENFAAEVHS
jgi:glutamine amidotransferase